VFPKSLYRGRPTTITGRRFVSEELRVRSADEETRAKAAGWVEDEQVAIDAATNAHWAQEDASNRAQWAQQAAATRAQREQQDQAQAAADQHQRDLVEQAVAKALGRHQERPKTYKTPLGRNISRLRKDCGWTYVDLAIVSEVSKNALLALVNQGTNPHPDTLTRLALAFSEKLGREVTVEELERES
jgi:hypothetical protein